MITQNTRLKTDKLALNSYIYDLFIQCRKRLIVDTNVTIDEQLVSFRGSCRFVQSIPSKLAKYSLQISVWLSS